MEALKSRITIQGLQFTLSLDLLYVVLITIIIIIIIIIYFYSELMTLWWNGNCV